MKKFSIVAYYAFALAGGLVSGGLFSRAMYHKGKADAYNECAEMLKEFGADVEAMVEKKNEEEAQ